MEIKFRIPNQEHNQHQHHNQDIDQAQNSHKTRPQIITHSKQTSTSTPESTSKK